MKRPKCIFCLTENPLLFNTKEHIIPESLGGGDWAILPDGLFCDKCQNIFGSSIEQQALSVYPFSNFRTLLGVPTKKKKAPWFSYWEGKLQSAGEAGKLIYEPNSLFKSAFESGRKTLTTIPAMPEKTDMVLRTLLKIGIETFAADLSTGDEIFSKKFDAARNFALTGKKNTSWFYIQNEDNSKLNKFLLDISYETWNENFFCDVHEDEGLIYLHLKMLYLDFLTPLIENVEPDNQLKDLLHEPQYRLIYV
jgi:HNH endonuclease